MPGFFTKLFSGFRSKPIKDDFDPLSFKPIKRPLTQNAPTPRTGGGAATTDSQDYDLKIIDRMCDTESLALQAFVKTEEKCVNTGYDFVSKDPDAAAYIRQRLREICIVNSTPQEVFIRQIVADCIRYSNCFLYKYRDPEASTGNPVQSASGPTEPIASYLRLDATSVIPERDAKGNIKRYIIGANGAGASGQPKKVKPEDIVHFYVAKNERNSLGTPLVWPAIDDIRALRQLEEGVELLMRKHLFPLYQYIIGTDTKPAELEELEKVYKDIGNIPTEGGFVTPERHRIEVLGAQGKAIDAAPYIKHFHDRVIEGLGIGQTSFGLTSGASRAGAEVIDRSLIERAKMYQEIFSAFFEDFIINELLEEGGFDIHAEGDDAVRVEIQFKEIDITMKVLKENHLTQMFMNNAITYSEMRKTLGYDTLDMESPDIQKEMFFYMFGPAIQSEFAMDEKAHAEKVKGAAAASKSQDRPSNQHGTKGAPGRARDINDSKATDHFGTQMLISSGKTHYENCRNDVLNTMASGQWPLSSTAKTNLKMTFGMASQNLGILSKAHIFNAFSEGVHTTGLSTISDDASFRGHVLDSKSEYVHDTHTRYIDQTMTNIQNVVINTMETQDRSEAVKKVSNAFDVRAHYIDHAMSTAVTSAFNYGRAIGLQLQGHDKVKVVANADSCEVCKRNHNKVVSLSNIVPADLPPHHASCNCGIEVESGHK
jgi:hypothetical protein